MCVKCSDKHYAMGLCVECSDKHYEVELCVECFDKHFDEWEYVQNVLINTASGNECRMF